MTAKNKILQKSLLVLLVLILPASIYTFTSVTAQQGGSQGFTFVNSTGTPTGNHNNPHISTGNSSATSIGNSSIATATGSSNTATVNGDSSTARAHGTDGSAPCLNDPASCNP